VRRVTWGLVLLRVIGVAALALLLWNPARPRPLPAGEQPVVLLDASLSMSADSWRAALDSARALAASKGAIVWRFGTAVTAFDSGAPVAGASRLAPALEAAAARGGEVIVLTDGEVGDMAALPPDLRRRPRVAVFPRDSAFDAFVASVDGPRHVTRTDTVRLRVSYGTAGTRDAGRGMRGAALAVSAGGRRLRSVPVTLPDSGLLSREITLPPSLVPPPGWHALEVRLEGINDREPRDDVRQFVIEVTPEPAAVVFASPPDWEVRFLARTLSDVARVPVRTFVETEPDRWRDAVTLEPVTPAALARAAQGARLIARVGDPDRSAFANRASAAELRWASAEGQPGDWYVDAAPASPLAGALAGIAWDSLPPAASAALPSLTDTAAITVLTARLARRGSARPIVTLSRAGGTRRATVTAAGLWRWAFRGGAAQEAYRALIAGLADWLLGEQGAASRERAVPVAREVPSGLPLVWQWIGGGEPQVLAISLQSDSGARTDTLRFDAGGRAELALPPGVYRYVIGGGSERGVVAVETYSDEYRPRAATLTAQPGESQGRFDLVGLRDRWWLFALAIAAFAAEWAWRRRQGLP
jgi:hypothetical protein